MHLKTLVLTTLFAGTLAAQQCTPVTGMVHDATGAVIADATVTVDTRPAIVTDKQGRFSLGCLSGRHTLLVEAISFAPETLPLNGATTFNITLKPETVTTAVDAVLDGSGLDTSAGEAAGSRTLNRQDLAQMADDPDDLQRQLQAMAAVSGGAPGAATITVDGFQNGSRMPPKSSIAFVRVNPDLFSAEYERPPYEGGRIEIITRPGQDKFHGSLFLTDSDTLFNARDPFATSRAAIGKRRYGFDLSGPFFSKKRDFTLSLEKRDIDDFAVVNAVTLDSNGNQQVTNQNVPTPQRLWMANARLGMMLNPKNNFTVSYTANVNSLANLAVGGTSLPEAGYDSQQAEHIIRATNVTTVSPRIVHETRTSFMWRNRDDAPHSTAAALQVAGAFTAGGYTGGLFQSHEKVTEVDDDILLSTKKHAIKLGLQMINNLEHLNQPDTFNGSYVFSGATVNGLNISGVEQYRRALLGLPGGTATTYTVNQGSPTVDFNQLRLVLFAQDQWKLTPHVQVALGLRYALQTSPSTFTNFGPRAGISWSPDKKQRLVLRARAGLFFSPIDTSNTAATLRLNGITQQQNLIYNANYGSPFAGATPVHALRTYAGNMMQVPSLQTHLGAEYEMPGHWHVQSNLYVVRAWDTMRSRNVNAPLNNQPTGPRPSLANTNIFQYQQTGHIHGNVLFVGVDQHSLRRFQIFLGYVRMDLRSDSDGAGTFPQSNLTKAGEESRPSWVNTHRVISIGQVSLPQKFTLSQVFNATSGSPVNLTTGLDTNGDGIFNERPQYATSAANAYQTPFGLLTATGGTGAFPRNAATLPWTVQLDTNLSRSFALSKKDTARTITFNARAANLLNHTNVTAMGSVLGSPLFLKPYASDAGRRIEFGARFNF
ncbi:TonB-dependent receptor [Terriglobus tenax]|uniref:TonB-dependent receptor n=1 Tax=Terriglobus tenax TaxID=1111115 RepID=UPI0021E05768|nr:carboxypeptidase regulatory-like domain-containing protein [Terriglobus tenax]